MDRTYYYSDYDIYYIHKKKKSKILIIPRIGLKIHAASCNFNFEEKECC